MNTCIICYNNNPDTMCVECINLFIFMYEHQSFDDEYYIENPLLCMFNQPINEKNIDRVSWNKIKSIEKKSKQRIEYRKMKDYDNNLEINLDKFLNGAEYTDLGIMDKLIIFNNNQELKDKYDLFCKNIDEQTRINFHNELSYQINIELPLNRKALMYCLEESEQRGYTILVKRIREVLDKN